MKVTVITICLNNAGGLRATLESIASQVVPDGVTVEHIVVDGHSADGSADLVDTTRSRLISAPPRGVYDALNQGITASTGDVVGFLHAGDVYSSPRSLATLVADFADPSTDFVWSDVTIGRRFFSGYDYTPDQLYEGAGPPHPSIYVSRRVIDRIGLYRTDYIVGGDFEYMVRLFRDPSLKGHYVTGPVIDMAPGGLSATLKARLYLNNRERIKTFRLHGIPFSWRRIFSHYKRVLQSFLCSPKKKK